MHLAVMLDLTYRTCKRNNHCSETGGFFTVVNIKASYFCDMLPCSLVESLPSFEERETACYSKISILFFPTTQYHILRIVVPIAVFLFQDQILDSVIKTMIIKIQHS